MGLGLWRKCQRAIEGPQKGGSTNLQDHPAAHRQLAYLNLRYLPTAQLLPNY